jgi:hypothetical protein
VAPIDTSAHLPDALDDVRRLAAGTSFEAHFSKPETMAYVEQVLHEHFHHSMHIERSWHADSQPEHPNSVAFRAAANEGHTLLTLHDDDLVQHGGRELVSAMILNQVSAAAPAKG